MTAIVQQTRGLALLVRINWDRLFYAVAIVAALWLGSVVGKILMH